MTPDKWTAVDEYTHDICIGADAALDAALTDSRAADLPPINVSPAQGKFLHLLARIANAKSILEIGTLAGYSTIWLARALSPGGRLVTLEFDPKHAEVAKKNLARAGLSHVVDLRLGKALDTLPKLIGQPPAPFDLIFIDADKPAVPDYFLWSLKLSRVGTIIIVDNVVRSGNITDAHSKDASIQGIRRFNEMLKQEKRVTATTLQTVGAKGYDGFTLALVTT
jgi:predicted O-methyltransferase YrrM